jgi:hypothetical protein
LSDPVPGTNNVTNSALIAELERCPTLLLYEIGNFFDRGYSFHGLLWPFRSI